MARNIDIVSVQMTFLKRIEKVCISNNVPYLTNGELPYNEAEYSIRSDKRNVNKKLIHFEDLTDFVINNSLESAMDSEFNLDLTPMTFLEWLGDNKEKRSVTL